MITFNDIETEASKFNLIITQRIIEGLYGFLIVVPENESICIFIIVNTDTIYHTMIDTWIDLFRDIRDLMNNTFNLSEGDILINMNSIYEKYKKIFILQQSAVNSPIVKYVSGTTFCQN